MGIFNSLTKAVFGIVVETPIAVIKDVATMGGVCTDHNEPYTLESLKKVSKNISDITE